MKQVVKIGEKEYTLEFTRRGVEDAERVFNTSLARVEAETVADSFNVLKTLLYAGLVKNHPTLTKDDMEDVLDEFIGEEGFEMEGLSQDLIKFLEAVLNPKGGGRRKSLLKK